MLRSLFDWKSAPVPDGTPAPTPDDPARSLQDLARLETAVANLTALKEEMQTLLAVNAADQPAKQHAVLSPPGLAGHSPDRATRDPTSGASAGVSAGAIAGATVDPTGNPPDLVPSKVTAGAPDGSTAKMAAGQPAAEPRSLRHRATGQRSLRHRVDGDTLRFWRAGTPEPERYPTAEIHSVEFLRWLGTRHTPGKWVAAADIQEFLYHEFCSERGWKRRPMQTMLRHMKALTRTREITLETGPHRAWRRTQLQYLIPVPEAAVIDLDVARERA
jgi:hypothetical protein